MSPDDIGILRRAFAVHMNPISVKSLINSAPVHEMLCNIAVRNIFLPVLDSCKPLEGRIDFDESFFADIIIFKARKEADEYKMAVTNSAHFNNQEFH